MRSAFNNSSSCHCSLVSLGARVRIVALLSTPFTGASQAMETEFRQDRTGLVQRPQRCLRGAKDHRCTSSPVEHPGRNHNTRIVGQQADVNCFATPLLLVQNINFALEDRVPAVQHARPKRDMGRMS
jgi:hypothetical protein